MHPLDLVKTRLQIQTGKTLNRDDPKHYAGVFDCLAKMYKQEGLTSYWKGILPPILAETPKRAVKVSEFSPASILKNVTINCFSFLLLNNINNFFCLDRPLLHL